MPLFAVISMSSPITIENTFPAQLISRIFPLPSGATDVHKQDYRGPQFQWLVAPTETAKPFLWEQPDLPFSECYKAISLRSGL